MLKSLLIFHSYCVEISMLVWEPVQSRRAMMWNPGDSIEYTKHRVSLEGHPWPGCHPEETPGIHIVMDRPSKEAIRLDIGRPMAWTVALVASRARSVVLLRSLREAESRLASSLASILAWKT